MWLTSAGLCGQSGTSGQTPGHPIKDLLHCVSSNQDLLRKRYKMEEEEGKRNLSPQHQVRPIYWGFMSEHKRATYPQPSFCLQYSVFISSTTTKLQKHFQGNDKPQSRIQLNVLGIQINSVRCLVQGTKYSTFK